MNTQLTPWGNYPLSKNQKTWSIPNRFSTLPENTPILPYGQGRSYGDVCQISNGTIVSTTNLNNFIEFDHTNGLITVESGITIGEILKIAIPKGWFIPVSPGTKFVSIGGAIGNDVHGKNHHRAGTFGCHVTKLELLRSNGERLLCSPKQNAELFNATIGGLGLTGLITWAQIQLKKINNPYIDTETIRIKNLTELLELARESDATHEYTVAWVDTTASGASIGRGLFMRGNHAPTTAKPVDDVYHKPIATMPIFMPNSFISTPLIKAFNWAYYRKQLQHTASAQQHYDPFFYPLDILQNWNRLYGKRGFQSFQCVVPHEQGQETITQLLKTIQESGLASPLTVVKIFGNVASPGLLSFPKPGINLLLDFPNVDPRLNALLKKLDEITATAGGRVNPSKDAHMSADYFQKFYPNWQEFEKHKDPAFTSDFWNRVTKS